MLGWVSGGHVVGCWSLRMIDGRVLVWVGYSFLSFQPTTNPPITTSTPTHLSPPTCGSPGWFYGRVLLACNRQAWVSGGYVGCLVVRDGRGEEEGRDYYTLLSPSPPNTPHNPLSPHSFSFIPSW